MPACLSRSVGLPPLFPVSSSSLKTMQMEDQENGKRRSVLRRTLSAAEMCSKSWRAHGIKKTASVEHLQSLVCDEEEGNGSGSGSGSGSEGALEDVWSSIRGKTEEVEQSKPTAVDVWGAILSEKKAGEDDVAPAAYVHPLVKRSASSLSEKSLEICTESLGSETGADGFSFSDGEKEVQNDVVFGVEGDEEMKEVGQEEEEDVGPMGDFSGYAVVGPTRTKRAVAAEGGKSRALPPPLPSLGHREDGSNLQMRCHRQGGRLVVEAVSVPSRNCFRAERQDGRLLLTFSDKESGEEEGHEFEDDDDDEEEEEISDMWDVEEEEEEEGEGDEGLEEEFAMEEEYGRGGMMMMMTTKNVDYKFLCLTRNSPPAASWAHRLNKVVPTPDDEDMAKSSPDSKGMGQIIPITAAGTAGTLNPYVYGWRSVPGGGASVVETKEGFVGGGGCNGQLQHTPTRRSLLFWPDRTRCIATT